MLILAVTYFPARWWYFPGSQSDHQHRASGRGMGNSHYVEFQRPWSYRDSYKDPEAESGIYVVQGYRDSLIDHVGFWQHPALTLYFWAFTLVLFSLEQDCSKTSSTFADVL